MLSSSVNERLHLSSSITFQSFNETSGENTHLANEEKFDANRVSTAEILLPKTAYEATQNLEALRLSSAVYYHHYYYFHFVMFIVHWMVFLLVLVLVVQFFQHSLLPPTTFGVFF